MILEKVYDELYGMIEDLKKKVASISGGSTVTITPTAESGEKIADYSIDGTSSALYSPFKIATQEITTLANGIGTTYFPSTAKVLAVSCSQNGSIVTLINTASGQTIRAIESDGSKPTWGELTYNVTYLYVDNTNTRTKTTKKK